MTKASFTSRSWSQSRRILKEDSIKGYSVISLQWTKIKRRATYSTIANTYFMRSSTKELINNTQRCQRWNAKSKNQWDSNCVQNPRWWTLKMLQIWYKWISVSHYPSPKIQSTTFPTCPRRIRIPWFSMGHRNFMFSFVSFIPFMRGSSRHMSFVMLLRRMK